MSHRIHDTRKANTNRAITFVRRFAVQIGTAMALFACGLQVSAGDNNPPELLTYQGFLADQNGTALGNSAPVNYTAVFRIYDQSTGGILLWSESQIITVDKGLFSVILGQGSVNGSEPRPTLSSVFAPSLASTAISDRFIGINVTISGTPTEITPRLRLVPSAYAFTARNANNIIDPAGTTVLTTSAGKIGINKSPATALDVNGTVTATAFSGNGSGLTGLTANQLPDHDASKITGGTLDSARLPANAALLNRDGQSFTGASNMFSGKIGIGSTTPGFPLTFGNTLGDKISFWGQSGNSYGVGVASSLLQIHTDSSSADISFGYGSSANMTETFRIKGNANVMFRGNAYMNDNTLLLHTDAFHGVGFMETFAGVAINSPVLFGYNGGMLGANQNGTTTYALRWAPDGHVGIGMPPFSNTRLAVEGTGTTYGMIIQPGASDKAAYFWGSVHVAGTLSKSAGSFKIDHPLDPENKWLSHSFVESPDMMNIYNGNIFTDEKGEATVTLPSYFEALNKDFRYQLTVIGQFAQAIVGRKISGNSFVIRTDKPSVEVSWQVTGIRKDAYANEHRIAVEEPKVGMEIGTYQHAAEHKKPSARQLRLPVSTKP